MLSDLWERISTIFFCNCIIMSYNYHFHFLLDIIYYKYFLILITIIDLQTHHRPISPLNLQTFASTLTHIFITYAPLPSPSINSSIPTKFIQETDQQKPQHQNYRNTHFLLLFFYPFLTLFPRHRPAPPPSWLGSVLHQLLIFCTVSGRSVYIWADPDKPDWTNFSCFLKSVFLINQVFIDSMFTSTDG